MVRLQISVFLIIVSVLFFYVSSDSGAAEREKGLTVKERLDKLEKNAIWAEVVPIADVQKFREDCIYLVEFDSGMYLFTEVHEDNINHFHGGNTVQVFSKDKTRTVGHVSKRIKRLLCLRLP